MIEIADRDVDESYRRGLADLVAHAPRPSTRTTERRVPRVAGIAAVSIPVAALVVSALVVIAVHGQRSVTPAAPATAGSGTNGVPIGKTIHVGPGHGLVANVTVQVVMFGKGSIVLPLLLKGDLNAEIHVRISSAATITTQPAQAAYDQASAEQARVMAQLDTAMLNHDTGAIATLDVLLPQLETKVEKLGLQLLPFNFQYVTTNDHVYPAWGASGFFLTTSPQVVMFNGRGDFGMIFQVPSRGGAIRMTDSFGQVIGLWRVPAA
jgi:hypothetical protein